MSIQDDIMRALSDLTQDGLFTVSQVHYDARAFGNVLVELVSPANIKLRIINDRGSTWCEVGIDSAPEKWYWLEDLLTVIGASDVQVDSGPDLIRALVSISKTVRDNINRIVEAVGKEHISNTIRHLDELTCRRKLERLKEWR